MCLGPCGDVSAGVGVSTLGEEKRAWWNEWNDCQENWRELRHAGGGESVVFAFIRVNGQAVGRHESLPRPDIVEAHPTNTIPPRGLDRWSPGCLDRGSSAPLPERNRLLGTWALTHLNKWRSYSYISCISFFLTHTSS